MDNLIYHENYLSLCSTTNQAVKYKAYINFRSTFSTWVIWVSSRLNPRFFRWENSNSILQRFLYSLRAFYLGLDYSQHRGRGLCLSQPFFCKEQFLSKNLIALSDFPLGLLEKEFSSHPVYLMIFLILATKPTSCLSNHFNQFIIHKQLSSHWTKRYKQMLSVLLNGIIYTLIQISTLSISYGAHTSPSFCLDKREKTLLLFCLINFSICIRNVR